MQEKTTVMSPVSLSHGADGRSFEGGRGPAHSGGGHWRDKPASTPNGSRGRRVLIALGVVLAVLVIAYGGGVVLFGNVCYPNTVIADTDVSLMTRDTAISRVRSSAEGYRLTVEGDGFTWTFDPESASEVIDAEAAVDRTIGANDPFEWPVRLVEALSNTDSNAAVESSADGGEEVSLDQIDLPQGFDRDAFLADLDAALDAFNETRTGTFDAAGAYDADAGKFTLEKARSNQKLDKEAIEVAALRAISTLSKNVTLDEGSFVPLAGGASESELRAAIDQANSLIGTDVDLKMGGSVVATLDGATFVQWMTFDESLKPTLSTEPLAQWVRDLAETKLDTIGCQRTYARPDGKVVTVSGGTYGWNSDEQQLVKLLQEAVANKQVGEIDIPTLQNAAVWTAKGEKDWGAYCDIDLTEQHCRYYDASGNILWESGCVTGNPNEGDATPTGVYILNAKRQNETLIGMDMDKDGEPDYRSPVAYWMPFVGNLIGLHDASWQSASVFTNPTAYLWAGSHGCVNLPTDKAGELYNLIQVGDCVIVHS
ncbi:L,D-transpeptidase [Collinsella stercoris]|uniref:L,D-transpeptidase n=1 Tax=Collinsella stercoris TaxID=147206 RepID=UPI0026F0DD02|nr:L,D-transpeptidase [Collinsella stercoris]